MTIEDGKFVTIEYVGTLEDGTVFDSTEKGGEPLEFQIGAGQIIPGFENAVREMDLDEEKDIVIPAKEAYGEPRDDLIHDFPKSDVPDTDKVTVGQQVVVTTDQGMPFTARILEITDEIVKIDLNHPLAGKTLNFKLKLIKVSDTGTAPSCGCCSEECDSC